MKLRTWGAAALAVCLGAATAAQLHAREFYAQQDAGAHGAQQPRAAAQGMAPSPVDDFSMAMEQSEFDSYGACSTCSTDCGYGGGGLLSSMAGGRPVMVVAGAEYLYAQATFSDALAYVEQDAGTGVDTFHQIDFGYNSSYAFYGGFYLPDCGGAVIAKYRRLTSDAQYSADESNFTEIFGPFEQSGMIEGEADVDLRNYDLAFSKTIPLGCLAGCGTQCGDCCDAGCGPCGGCGWCPAWDITWFGGIRFADVGWGNTIRELDPNVTGTPIVGSATTTLDFDGFGGLVGIMGRRYIGQRGLFSVYGKGEFSVLFGDVDIETVITDSGVGDTAAIRTSNEITVPVTEIELGASVHLGPHATLSTGYFWTAWHDLGMSPTPELGGVFEVSHYDDANILGFNGLFARAEVAF